jgi:hypothetical protein
MRGGDRSSPWIHRISRPSSPPFLWCRPFFHRLNLTFHSGSRINFCSTTRWIHQYLLILMYKTTPYRLPLDWIRGLRMDTDEYGRVRLPSNPVCFRERSSLPSRGWVEELVGGPESKTRRSGFIQCFFPVESPKRLFDCIRRF